MILLVTAYTGMWIRGDRLGCIHGYTQSYTQGYSKYFGQARVRTVHACVPAGPLPSCPAGGASSDSGSQHAPPEAAGDRPEKVE